MYLLLDANVTAAYYLPLCTKSKNVARRIENIFNSIRSKEANHFLYLPNFCVAEVFGVFMKYSFGSWNRQVRKTIDTRIYRSLVEQFQNDIHNGQFIYHYELSRYHILGINLVAPIDHYYQISRKNKNVIPSGTFDHLIISMGIHLAHIHGSENVTLISADDRLIEILAKCRKGIPWNTRQKLKLNDAESLTGRKFQPKSFPRYVNLKRAKKNELSDIFGIWPLPVGKMQKVYRLIK